MVQNLNILSFASYGNLLTERPGGVACENMNNSISLPILR